MPPKKRIAPAATASTAAKRTKMSMATSKSDITTRNSMDSPLLRLPAELREAIWDFAYSNMMVVVYAKVHRNEPDEPVTELVYHVYDKIFTGQSMQDAQDALSRPPNLVCRQFWAETSRIFLNSYTLRTSCRVAMLALVSTKQDFIQRVRNLIIAYNSYDPTSFSGHWAGVLTCSTVGRFIDLEGIELYVWIHRFDGWRSNTDVMNDDYWKRMKLPQIVRAFQQPKLKLSLTSVNFINRFDAHGAGKRWLAKFNGAIRKELLSHYFRRVSRRGGVEDDSS